MTLVEIHSEAGSRIGVLGVQSPFSTTNIDKNFLKIP